MHLNNINITLKSNNKTLEIGTNTRYGLLDIDGIDSADYELSVSKNPLADGSTVNSKRIDSRSIDITAEYKGRDKERERIELVRFFNPHKEGELYIDLQGNKKKIKYEVESFKAKLDNLNKPLRFMVSLYCADPFWRELEESEIDLVTWIPNLEFTDDGFYTEQEYNSWLETTQDMGFDEFESGFGRGYGVEFGYREIKQIVEVENKGDVDCPMTIVLRANGEVVNPYIQDVETYEKLCINGILDNGDTMIITTGYNNKNILLNGKKAKQYFNFLNSTWLQLKPGMNLIKYDAESGLNNLECSVFYTPLYLGV